MQLLWCWRIPSLGKGEAIITGNAMKAPVFVKVNKEMDIRPSSDDVNLTDVWKTVEVPQEIRESVFEWLI